jgi:adenine-specific DNA-methyltransferase
VPRDATQDALIHRLRRMPCRLADWGYQISTGPLVWNRHKNQLRERDGAECLPLIWADAVRPDGTFRLLPLKSHRRPFFKVGARDGWLITDTSCVLVQRTTAKEQPRRLVAAVLPRSVVRQRGGVVVENHLNMIRPTHSTPLVSPATLAAFLNSAIVDDVFRCLSGSVAVSAYELEALPLPSPTHLRGFDAAVRNRAARERLDEICAELYEFGTSA